MAQMKRKRIDCGDIMTATPVELKITNKNSLHLVCPGPWYGVVSVAVWRS